MNDPFALLILSSIVLVGIPTAASAVIVIRNFRGVDE